MSTIKLSLKYLQNKIKKTIITNIENLETRLEMVNNKNKQESSTQKKERN